MQDQQALIQDILTLARRFGEVLALDQDPAGLLHFRVEFFRLGDAHELLKEVDTMCPLFQQRKSDLHPIPATPIIDATAQSLLHD